MGANNVILYQTQGWSGNTAGGAEGAVTPDNQINQMKLLKQFHQTKQFQIIEQIKQIRSYMGWFAEKSATPKI